MSLRLNYLLGTLFLLVISSLSISVSAQNFDKQEWAKGEVTLTNGDIISGPITYYYKQEIVQVKSTDGSIRTFSPVNIASFRVFNEQKLVIQTFRPYLWSQRTDNNAYKTPAFFEVVTEGKYTLIKRAAYTIRNLDPMPIYAAYGKFYEADNITQTQLEGDYYQVAKINLFYVLTPDNKIITLRNPKKNLEALYQDKVAAMNTYIKRKNLSYNDPIALTHMIRYFNYL